MFHVHRRIRPALVSLLVGCATLALACTTVTSTTLGPAIQRESQRMAEQLEKSGALLDDPALTAYVNRVGKRIVAEVDRSPVPAFAFAVLDSPDPNAFAIPSGHIYVSRGLLMLLNTEDELAGILGHEVGHVVKQHSLKKVSGSVAFAPFRVATAIGGGIVGLVLPRAGRAVRATTDVPAALAGASYGRSQESEADQVGQTLATRAGWDPSGLPRVMEALAEQQRLRGEDPSRSSWLATHPPSPDRAARLRERADALGISGNGSDAIPRGEFLAKLEGLVVGAGAAGGVFVDDLFLHPGLGFAARFPSGESWTAVNTDRAVAAVCEQPPSAVILELVARGEDALGVATAFDPDQGKLDGPPRAEEVNGLPTAHSTGGVRGRRGAPSIRASARWIGFDGHTYRILSESTEAGYERFAEDFDAAERSFRALTDADRARIFEDRLRVVSAREGEVLRELIERVDSSWDVAEAAAANGVKLDDRLEAGALVKITRREPYDSGR